VCSFLLSYPSLAFRFIVSLTAQAGGNRSESIKVYKASHSRFSFGVVTRNIYSPPHRVTAPDTTGEEILMTDSGYTVRGHRDD
jgi:hypothetical protein